jgi:hypothetical protein
MREHYQCPMEASPRWKKVEMDTDRRTYEAPAIAVVGEVRDMTLDGNVHKVGSATDAYSALDATLTGSIVNITPGT